MNTETKHTPGTVEDETQWQSCSRKQLEHLAEHGSYGQRLIANRYLRDWEKDHQ